MMDEGYQTGYGTSIGEQADYDPYSMDYNSSTYPSETPHYAVSAQDWDKAREELAHLGLSGSHDYLSQDPSLSCDYQQDHNISAQGFHSDSNCYDKDLSPNLNFSVVDRPDYSTHLASDPSSHHLDSSEHFLDHHHHASHSSPRDNLPRSSDYDSPHTSSLYSPDGRSRYDHQLSSLSTSHSDFLDDPIQFSNHGPPTDPYKVGEGLFEDPLLAKNHQPYNFRSSSLHHSDDEYGHTSNFDTHDDLYQDHSYHNPYPDVRNSDSRDIRLDEAYSSPNVGSDFLDSRASSSDYSGLPYELGASRNHDSSRYDEVFQPGYKADSSRPHHHQHHHYRTDDYINSPRADEFLDRPSLGRSSFHDDNLDASGSFPDPLYGDSTAECLGDFTRQSSSPHEPDYSLHNINLQDHQARLTSQSYRDDPLHVTSDPALASQSNVHHYNYSDELRARMRSQVDRALQEPLNDIHHPEHPSDPLCTSKSNYLTQREEIERMRAQLDQSTLNNVAPLLESERSFSCSREPMSSLSGRRSPHSKSSHPRLMASMSTLDSNSTLGLNSRMDLPPARSRMPLSVDSGRCSPYLNLSRDSWPSSAVSMIPRTPSALGISSRHHHLTDPLDTHGNSLRNQLHEIGNLTHEIRRSEQAHQQELAEITQVTSKLAQQSLNDNLRQAKAAYQCEISLANQQATLERQSLDRDLHHEIGYRQDLALADQRAVRLSQPSMIQDTRENAILRELDEQRRLLDLQRAELSRQQDRAETQAQLSQIDRQLRAIDHQREIDSNRQLANLTRFGNLPSVLKGNYGGRPLAPPYLQQSRLLSAMRRWSSRDKPRHDSPIVYDHIDAYYSLMSDHLPKHLPMFQDPYYRYSPHHHHTSSKTLLGLTPSTRLGSELRMDNPFVDGIDYDYGFGKVGSLGLKYEQFAREQAYILDDLYLYELLLRLDQTIDDVERRRRWRARLRWEEWKDNRSRVEAWKRMTSHERKSLGLSEGSYWASNLFGIPLDSRFGYMSPLSSPRYRVNDLRTHYTLTPSLLSRYPMWKRGGLGLGRRLSHWYDYMRRPTHHTNLDQHSRFHQGYPHRRGLSTDSNLRSPGLLSGSNHYPHLNRTSGTASNLSKHLTPLTPLLQSSSISNGMPRVPSSGSTLLDSQIGALNLSSASKSGATSSKGTSNSTSTFPSSKTTTKTNNTSVPVNSVNTPSKSLSATNSNKLNGVQMVPKKPIPLKPGALATPSDSRHSQSTFQSQHLSVGTSNRPMTPRGTNNKEGNAIVRSTTPTVVFNPRVTAVPPESESDPPPIPRPPSRSFIKPPPSVLKTSNNHNNHKRNPSCLDQNSHLQSSVLPVNSSDDDRKLDLITKINTERNRSTPAPPENHDDKNSHSKTTACARSSN